MPILIAPSRPQDFAAPQTTLAENLEITARRYPASAAIHFLGTTISYAEVLRQVRALAGWMHKAGITHGDRVAIYMQNSPQWVIAFYAVQRLGAVVVPVSPQNREGELIHYLSDSGARLLVCGGELLPTAEAAARALGGLRLLVASYADYLPQESFVPLPGWLTARHPAGGQAVWAEAMEADHAPPPYTGTPDDLCALPYTSGSTGKPKACMHTHRSLGHTAAGLTYWHGILPGDVSLGVAPMYHVSGLCHAVTSPVFAGAAIAIVPRWDRALVIEVMERYRVTHASLAPTAVIDLMGIPGLEERDLSALRRMTSGGATMPEAVWQRLRDMLGISFLEAYGMTETAATTHLNPPEAPRLRCLGVPFFGTEALIVDADTLVPLRDGEVGEILLRGPQMFQGYWNRPEATAEAFVEVDGKPFFRSGDIGYADADGYFYMTDRAKRMINASGLKVWPNEVESILYRHPAVLEACVVGVADTYRGETVKALVVLRPGAALDEAGLIAWAREQMAAYKYPRLVEFVESLPKSPAGKILWRELQDREAAKVTS
ncbi:MAG: long-chain fatty acid-CoA ligase [Rubritepida sp.]|nr:long-chain fatty acid-CoA ligase [Rubritepida sp.]